MSNEAENTSFFQREAWYTDAQGKSVVNSITSTVIDYWTGVPATINGMLGGYASVTSTDTKASSLFISEFIKGKRGANNRILKPPRISTDYACDCGAGIGRVSKHFLLKHFNKVDLVEYTPKFIEQAEESYLAKEKQEGRVGRFICEGLQTFTPEEGKYDLIWCQWVLSHLTDEDLVSFLVRCKRGLKANGIIGIKENVTAVGYSFDNEDSSVTRRVIVDNVFTNSFLIDSRHNIYA
ncbi:2504_t:CDS:2 [Paraglomus brasilianum]|uniref:Alpha N-terminal protein methyltransferase 1 n=1 Tax=Paraglomus brasilianum TaxID=144538 RepID=A0A9N9GHW5_9GLOM|nr:2504_t:CDS:2 [Paraglomus brasilianum]